MMPSQGLKQIPSELIKVIIGLLFEIVLGIKKSRFYMGINILRKGLHVQI